MDIIQALITCMPFFRDTIRQDVTLSIIDREKFLYFSAGESLKQLEFKAGDPLLEPNRNFADLKGTTEKQFDHYPKELFGVPFDVSYLPIKTNRVRSSPYSICSTAWTTRLSYNSSWKRRSI